MKELYRVLKIKANASTAYHPQTDGQTERVNQEVREFLTMFVNHQQDDWSDWLAVAQFCHNDRVHSATGFSPFFLNNGRNPRKGLELTMERKVQAVDEWIERLVEACDQARQGLNQAAENMRKQYNKKRQPAKEYKKGDWVYLNAQNLPTLRVTKKLEGKFVGPYKVIEKVGGTAYRIRIPASWKVYNVFNEVLLKLHKPAVFPKQQKQEKEWKQRKEDDHTKRDEEFEVEEVIDSRLKTRRGSRTGRLEYLVKWKGYPNEEATWETADNLEHAHRKVQAFHKKKPSAPRPTSIPADFFQRYHNHTDPVIPKKLFGWEDGKFDKDYLRNMDKRWAEWKSM